MKLILVLALAIAAVSGRMITQDELLAGARGILSEARMIQATDGSNVLCFHCEEEEAAAKWYDSAVFYQIYPRSFMDADNDGNGDLVGIRMKLRHLKELGVNGVWLSPVFKSPQKDGGYDIESFVDIDPMYGTMADMDALILEAKRLGIKLILDFVPNHTSDQHEWFKKSVLGEEPYDKYYVWVDGKNCLPEAEWDPEKIVVPCELPNNWVSVFFGPMWDWSWERGQFYLHQFTKEQPDVNFDSDELRQEFVDILEFWMMKGIDGFRVDAINHAYETPNFPDEALLEGPGRDPTNWNDYFHNHTKDLPKSFDLVYDWRDLLDRFSLVREIEPKVMMTEAYPLLPDNVFRWFGDKDSGRIGSQIAFNFILISDLDDKSTAADYAKEINYWLDNVPEGEKPNWVLGNHDRDRVATRFNPELSLGLAFLEFTLPGYAVIYNGEEIGMVNNGEITWEETRDPQACNTNETVYKQFSRDPVRTPFQWDDTVNAGFNTGFKTWLPVHENYRTLNLKMQKDDPKSTYNLYRNLIKLRKESIFRQGATKVHAFEDENVLAVLRSLGDDHYVTVINLSGGEDAVTVDLTTLDEKANQLSGAMLIYSTPGYHQQHDNFADDDEHGPHDVVNSKKFQLRAHDAVIVKLVEVANSASSIAVSIALLVLSIARYFF